MDETQPSPEDSSFQDENDLDILKEENTPQEQEDETLVDAQDVQENTQEDAPSPEQEQVAATDHESPGSSCTPQAQDPCTAIQEVPLSLTVEVCRLQMNAKTLLELEAGKVIDLSISPENPVSLTLEGRPVAKGELMRLGDILGLRITNIGS